MKANTERYMKSSIPYMQKLLNKEDESVNKLLSQSSSNSKIFYASELCLQPADSITIDNLNLYSSSHFTSGRRKVCAD